MADKLIFYQINLNKCNGAQSNLMVELVELKDKQFVCLIQEPHFYGLKPSKSREFFHKILAQLDRRFQRNYI